MAEFQLAEETQIGFVALKVNNLHEMTRWYQETLGLVVLEETSKQVFLGTRLNQRVLVLLTQLNSGESSTGLSGLDHFALLLPNSASLGSAYQQAKSSTDITDRFITGYTEGFTVADPEGNAIELIIDKAIEQYQSVSDFDWEDDTKQPATDAQLSQQHDDDYAGLPSGTTIGHIALKVNDINASADYLVKVLGFAEKASSTEKEAFLTTGDSHHHIGIELVASTTSGQAGEQTLGLDYVNLLLPSEKPLEDLMANLKATETTDYDYNPDHHYLRIAGPSNLTLWFSVA
ncbi:VOC family protein [Lacticaseibacillus brantae]|uniref:Ring-cleavage extradiol dioxygenase n=1 Tax=Lacticaseibacillus brantae DSM 23927 TaxID=1423727 RepID=A0A0R2BAZ3_9LACO|nr:VOC family protein [Lacticaseibacillus brantae]KRM72956.1 ring-cleavage extradiol dioxygenase [Lacticaseibacillus brantae DSM 23927]